MAKDTWHQKTIKKMVDEATDNEAAFLINKLRAYRLEHPIEGIDGPKNIYIASSWKNQHLVTLLSEALRSNFICRVHSFVENAFNEGYYARAQMKPFREWYNSEDGEGAFKFDSGWAANADLIIYLCPSGKDAMCEVGIAYANKKPILGLWAKGEDEGLMHKCVSHWFDDHESLLTGVGTVLNEGVPIEWMEGNTPTKVI